MPYKSESIPISGTRLDRRCVLTSEQREAIKLLYEEGFSYRKLAEMFRCSKWTIQNLIHPQKRSNQPKKPKEYWTVKKREYRQRKQQLYVAGQLNPNKRKKK